MHRLAFTRGQGLFGLMRRLFGRWDKKPGVVGRMAYGVERGSKQLLYGCQDCGDCSLPDCAYLCPRLSCSKCGRNGPCGGSAGGRCELDDKECFWARVYERLKSYGESEKMLERPPVFYNAELKNTSSWANFYLDRDHSAKQPGRREGGRGPLRNRTEQRPRIADSEGEAMAIAGLTIIGETINDSVPSTKKLFDAGDIAGLLELARFQDEKGAALHRRERRPAVAASSWPTWSARSRA